MIFFCFQLAENLLKKETLNYTDVEALLGPPPFGKKRLIEPADFEESLKSKERDSEEKDNDNTLKETDVTINKQNYL